jgi:hypothetical protein
MRRFLLAVTTAASALAATSCTDLAGIRDDLEGSYVLWTVNGASLPEYVSEIDVEIVSGEVTLYNDGTYDDVLRYRESGSSFIAEAESSGRYTVSGDRIRFNPDDSGLADYFMDWDNDRLYQEEEGVVLEYRR